MPENIFSRGRRLSSKNFGTTGSENLRQDIDLEVARNESDDILHEIGMESENIVKAGQIFRRVRNGDQAEFFVMPLVEGLAALNCEAPGKTG
ncbi:MAG TPA: hypothetical protein VMZ49_06960 [Patescibacteria group bacterium]|nr:hypothetical protein [Patescibacteria group bacterium]